MTISPISWIEDRSHRRAIDCTESAMLAFKRMSDPRKPRIASDKHRLRSGGLPTASISTWSRSVVGFKSKRSDAVIRLKSIKLPNKDNGIQSTNLSGIVQALPRTQFSRSHRPSKLFLSARWHLLAQ